MYKRYLNLSNLLKLRSFFLFGPRGTGKSTLIVQTLPDCFKYDLLDSDTFLELAKRPKLIGEQAPKDKIIVIDEIQRMPELLNEVHRLIFNEKRKFLLTGSSARKLKKKGVNLLAGRAFQCDLFPLTSWEIPSFDLLTYLNTTGLPEFYGQPMADEFLKSYIGTYLKEEIRNETQIRNLPAFGRFLEVVALSNGQEINYASISSDCGIPQRTLEGHFSILNDTLLGFSVCAFLQTKKRKAITRSKYYLFDIGVVRFLTLRSKVEFGSELFGHAFEHFIALELRAYLSYKRSNLILQYWRSTTQFEVDFIIGNQLAIEVKGTNLVQDKHLKGLRSLKEEGLIAHYCIVSTDVAIRETQDGIKIWPWKDFLTNLWNDKIISLV